MTIRVWSLREISSSTPRSEQGIQNTARTIQTGLIAPIMKIGTHLKRHKPQGQVLKRHIYGVRPWKYSVC
jgi:hypothetical protein